MNSNTLDRKFVLKVMVQNRAVLVISRR